MNTSAAVTEDCKKDLLKRPTGGMTHGHSVKCCRVYLQAQWFPAHVPEQSRRGAQGVLGPFLQREYDAAWVFSQSVDQVLQLPAHLRSTHTHTPGCRINCCKELRTHRCSVCRRRREQPNQPEEKPPCTDLKLPKLLLQSTTKIPHAIC